MSSDDSYLDEYIINQRIYESMASQPPAYEPDYPEARTRAPPRRKHGEEQGADEVGKGILSAKSVFYIIVFTAMATAVVNPSMLVVTLPLATLFASMLALARRRKRREPRRVGHEF